MIILYTLKDRLYEKDIQLAGRQTSRSSRETYWNERRARPVIQSHGIAGFHGTSALRHLRDPGIRSLPAQRGALDLTWTLKGGLVELPGFPGYDAQSIPYGINASGIAVGSVGSGSTMIATIFERDRSRVIHTRPPSGAYFQIAHSINDSGVVVRLVSDPVRPLRSVPLVYESKAMPPRARELVPLPGDDGGECFAISNSGFVAGISTLGLGASRPAIWDPRGVNQRGWAVGNAAVFLENTINSAPILWNGTATYRLKHLVPVRSDWDLEGDTAGTAITITDGGKAIGTGRYNNVDRAFMLVPRRDVPVVAVSFDVDTGSDVNQIDLAASKFVQAAIAGSPSFDVTSVNAETVRLNGVAPLKWKYHDVAGKDGATDLEFWFPSDALAAGLDVSGNVRRVLLSATAVANDRTMP